MEKVIILTPLFNDWLSLRRLLKEVNTFLIKISKNIEILIVDDCSTEKLKSQIKANGNIKKIRVLRLKKNIGSQRAIFKGLKKIYNANQKATVVIMDSDGEDDIKALKKMITLSRKNPNYVVTGNRNSRSEGFLFTFLYKMHLFLTFILTGKYLNFGNFSAFNSKNLKIMLKNANLKIAYSAGLKKNVKNIISCYSDRKKRYYGNSKVSFYFLFLHSLNILTVLRKELITRSLLILTFIYFLSYLNENFYLYSIFIFILLVCLNIFTNLNSFFKNLQND